MDEKILKLYKEQERLLDQFLSAPTIEKKFKYLEIGQKFMSKNEIFNKISDSQALLVGSELEITFNLDDNVLVSEKC